ncbi:MAG: peptidase [Bacteroidota bacterium]
MRPTLLSVRLRAFLLLLALLPVAACDMTEEPPISDLRIVGGVSFERLFADPTATEIQAVRDDWASRTTSATDAQIVASAAFDGATVHVVSHTMTGGPGAPFTHVGVVRVPDGLADDAPVLVVHHGGDSGVSIRTSGGFSTANTSIEALADVFPSLMEQTVQVVPAYRSEFLRAGIAGLEAEYSSGGSASPWDYDVDDSMALLSVALDLFADETDPDRIAALGFSRGANVALLHQIRDDRIDAVTEYYGPTDFYNEGAQQLASALVLGAQLPLPGAEYLFDEVLNPLRDATGGYDENADYSSARLDVLRRSASVFTSDLTTVQVHHHESDPVVPFSFSEAFDARAGSVSGSYEFNTYTNAVPSLGAEHSPEGLPESQAATEGWLLQALGVSASTLTEAGRPGVQRSTSVR